MRSWSIVMNSTRINQDGFQGEPPEDRPDRVYFNQWLILYTSGRSLPTNPIDGATKQNNTSTLAEKCLYKFFPRKFNGLRIIIFIYHFK